MKPQSSIFLGNPNQQTPSINAANTLNNPQDPTSNFQTPAPPGNRQLGGPISGAASAQQTPFRAPQLATPARTSSNFDFSKMSMASGFNVQARQPPQPRSSAAPVQRGSLSVANKPLPAGPNQTSPLTPGAISPPVPQPSVQIGANITRQVGANPALFRSNTVLNNRPQLSAILETAPKEPAQTPPHPPEGAVQDSPSNLFNAQKNQAPQQQIQLPPPQPETQALPSNIALRRSTPIGATPKGTIMTVQQFQILPPSNQYRYLQQQQQQYMQEAQPFQRLTQQQLMQMSPEQQQKYNQLRQMQFSLQQLQQVYQKCQQEAVKQTIQETTQPPVQEPTPEPQPEPIVEAVSPATPNAVVEPIVSPPQQHKPLTLNQPEPAPIQPSPIQPAPIQPAPIQPAPIQPAPIQPSPIQPAPIQPAPIQPAPIQPVPIQPSPTQPSPIQPSPEPVVTPEFKPIISPAPEPQQQQLEIPTVSITPPSIFNNSQPVISPISITSPNIFSPSSKSILSPIRQGAPTMPGDLPTHLSPIQSQPALSSQTPLQPIPLQPFEEQQQSPTQTNSFPSPIPNVVIPMNQEVAQPSQLEQPFPAQTELLKPPIFANEVLNEEEFTFDEDNNQLNEEKAIEAEFEQEATNDATPETDVAYSLQNKSPEVELPPREPGENPTDVFSQPMDDFALNNLIGGDIGYMPGNFNFVADMGDLNLSSNVGLDPFATDSIPQSGDGSCMIPGMMDIGLPNINNMSFNSEGIDLSVNLDSSQSQKEQVETDAGARYHSLTVDIDFKQLKDIKFHGRRETLRSTQPQAGRPPVKPARSSLTSCLRPVITTESMNAVNEPIRNLLENSAGIHQYSWSSHYVVNCIPESNPYMDPGAIQLSMQGAYSKHHIIRLFSEDSKPLHFQKIVEKPPNIRDGPTPIFLSDVTDKHKPPRVAESTIIPSAPHLFTKNSRNPPPIFVVEDLPITELSKRKFATLKVEDIKTDFELLEPMFLSAFIVQDGQMISESWYFTPQKTSQFVPDMIPNSKASFEIPLNVENSFFCVVASRFLLPENGANVNKYYLKPTPKLRGPAKTQADFFEKFSGILAPYAITYVDLKNIIDTKFINLPQPFAVTQPIKNIFKYFKPGVYQKANEAIFPISISISANVVETTHVHDLMTKNDIAIRLTTPLPNQPCFFYRHRFMVRLNQVTLHTNSRNIYAEISVKEDLPLFTSPLKKGKCKSTFTRCWYHEKKPIFDEQFAIDLPYPIPQTLNLVIKFMNASLKNVAGAKGNGALVETIGTCIVTLIDGDKIIEDGQHMVSVEYPGMGPMPPTVSLTTTLDSSFISTDTNLNNFYKKVNSQVLQSCDSREVTINMFLIIDQIVGDIINNGLECVKSLAALTKKVAPLGWKNIERNLNDYAIYFALRNEESINPQFHKSLLRAWAQYMETQQSDTREDNSLIPFFFNLIIKSLYLTKDQSYGEEFTEFIVQWSRLMDSQQISEYARFLNLLFDVGGFYYSVIAIECQMAHLLSTTSNSNINIIKNQTILIEFLNQVFRPKLFYAAIIHVNLLNENIIELISHSKSDGSSTLQFIYPNFLRLFAQYSDEMNEKIAEKLVNVLGELSPFNTLPSEWNVSDGTHSAIYFFSYILSNIAYEPFKKWFSENMKVNDFFETLHFIIDKVKDRELIKVTQYAILHALSHIIEMKDDEGTIEATNVIYHYFCVDISLDFLPSLLELFSRIILQDFENTLIYSKPAMTRQIIRVLEFSAFNQEMTTKLLRTLFDTDLSVCGNNRRSFAICCRALASLKTLEFVRVTSDHPIFPIINELKNIELESKSVMSEEKTTELMKKKAKLLFHSPDAAIEVLSELVEYQRNHEYFAEEIQTLLLQASIVMEFMVAQKRMNIDYMHASRPAEIYSDICPSCLEFVCPPDGNFVALTYCDSPIFSERSLINHLIFILERSAQTRYFEMGYYLIDKIWPLFEHRRLFSLLESTFKMFNQAYETIAGIPSDEERLFGKYFRINFYGQVFKELNGSTFIYREKKLTHLFELTNRLESHYTELYKPTPIELIKESGNVDQSRLEPNRGYIQVTFVEPFFMKKEMHVRMTAYERNHLIRIFYFDTPFTKGSGKAQASIDQQWIRRTLLTVQEPMPSLIKRIRVIDMTEKEFAPIRVAYRQLRDRITQLKNAVDRMDYRAIQQLLHESLLVQVNEGPSRMAEVFLADNQEKSNYTDKMKAAFKEFLHINEIGLAIHGKWVTDNPAFVPLQHELESGLTGLSEKLSKYITV
ncbi:hypothetical protein TRFO_21506 [Tritrichomonas foetus]|uniref:Uncharacterized protein n=1 Tax=Tritrichomonas foetus TaxID=1144522 RepID=A0A1J4KIM4_9EUKA|nr:hypothetical protein TRFO_21506 [Tritrichomonas foetus]|eukprot:OHT09550.1 hypothetical protein TRFO_21506 [Tritrichomonas foetus]